MPPRPRSAGVTCDVGEVGESEALRVWDSAASRRRQDGDAEVDECGWIAVSSCAAKALPRLPIRRTHVDNDDDAGFPKLAAPARRALSAAGITRTN